MIEMLKAFLTLKLIKKDGSEEVIYDGDSHSWVKNYYQFVLGQSSGINAVITTYGTNAVALNGVPSSTNYTLHGIRSSDAAWFDSNNTSTGCVIGKSASIESFTDYSLGTITTNGTGLDQFQYSVGSQSFTTATNGTTLRCKMDRTFTNNSGSTINVAESGLYGRVVVDNLNRNMLVMFNRDTFGTIGVSNGDALYVAYTIQLTMPGAIV